MNAPRLCIVVPCYNEEETLPRSLDILLEALTRLHGKRKTAENSYICCIDDGSRDGTWALIEQRSSENRQVKGIKLSANFGHQNALIAGLFTEYPHADCLISIDADLQDDVDAVERMMDAFGKGFRVVYGVRSIRTADSRSKRWLAEGFYAVMKKMNPKSITNHADFRLAGSEVIRHLERFGEVNLYLRSIFPLIGFPSTCVYYERKQRLTGKTKYPIRKQMSFAWQGITSFSTVPLKMIFRLGIFTTVISLALCIWVLWAALSGHVIKGWASTVIPILFFSGIIILSLGIIGEYVGKIYQEVKNRPRFIIETQTEENLTFPR
ncbi:MAG: glycosyltransferase family 2 protein [Bacteroidales bacterium]|jgi:glycosyltransferase involved in cell wall biosynthesis|nr:glycosyltransferase family 2 protein [Bacteroidales bacterium]